MIVGTAPWLYLTLRPDPAGTGYIRLVPFSDLAFLSQGPVDFLIVQVVGNLLVFAALGFFLPIRSAAFASIPKVLAVGAFASLGIELTQLLAHLFLAYGRTFSVDDIMLNAAGAALAAACSRRWWAGPQIDQATP